MAPTHCMAACNELCCQRCHLVLLVSVVPTGRHVVSIPLGRATEFVAFSPRQSRLLALAETVVVAPAYRDSKSRDTTACHVALVLLK